MTDRTADDEARWAEALSLVEHQPTEAAEGRLRRTRRNRLLAIAAFTVLCLAVALVVGLLVLDRGLDEPDQDLPTWRAVVGLSVSGLGLVVMVVGIVLLLRTVRGHRGWRSALNVLTFRQRRELVAQLRGRTPLVPERLPLVRATADQLMASQLSLLLQAGLLLSLLGQWIADPSTWRVVLLAAFGTVLLLAAVFVQRDVQHARRFLDRHPGVEPARD